MGILIEQPALMRQTRSTTLDVGAQVRDIKAGKGGHAPAETTSQAIKNIQNSIHDIESILRSVSANVLPNIFVVAPGGEVIGWIGTYGGYQGAWFKTLYVGGTSPADAPFIADIDGNLSITNAIINLTGTGGSIVLDPTVPSIVATAAGAAPQPRATLNPGSLLFDNTGTPANTVEIDHNSFDAVNPTTLAETVIGPGEFNMYVSPLPSNLEAMAIWGYSPSGRGPFLNFKTASGTIASPGAPSLGDSMGGVSVEPFFVGGVSGRAGFYAAETQSGGNLGTEYRIYTTPNGSTTLTLGLSVGSDQVVSVGAIGSSSYVSAGSYVDTPQYKVSGVDGIDASITYGTSLSTTVITGFIAATSGGAVTKPLSAIATISLITSSRTFSKGLITA